jgi:ABC-type nitrate/sulfonate/bicarbonate transport system substrate-binding protein
VKFETTGNTPAALDMAKQGRVDCFIASINVVMTLERMKEAIEIWNTDKYVRVPGQCYITSRQMVEQRPETIQKIINGLKASVLEIMSEPLGPIFDRASKDFEIPGIKDKENLILINNTSRERFWLSEGRENLLRNVPRLWKEGADAMRDSGFAKIDNAEQLYTNAFIDKA